ncbi:hypothetical protein [Streptomyces katrae]|uniref:ATP-dependent DNA ligase n=1 Tax=Streptomyces katrae TaxID=68223 RepID=UPI001F2BD55A|nr:hypothetical protein [Streptomyces katrae]
MSRWGRRRTPRSPAWVSTGSRWDENSPAAPNHASSRHSPQTTAARQRPACPHPQVLTVPRPGGRLLLQTRRGVLVQDRFPDLVAAAEQLPEGLVLDGELVVWDTAAGRLSCQALQRRAAARGRTATAFAAKTPAFFIAFDALQIDGIELLALPYAECRRCLEILFAARALTTLWTLCPMTRAMVGLPVPDFLRLDQPLPQVGDRDDQKAETSLPQANNEGDAEARRGAGGGRRRPTLCGHAGGRRRPGRAGWCRRSPARSPR